MKVLLTGAGGSIGYETLKQLIETEHDITILDLETTKNKRKFSKYKKQVNVVYGTVNDNELINDLVKEQDVIIHLAAIIPPLSDKKPELARKVNFIGTQNIVNAMLESKKDPFLLYSSSISVYGDRLEKFWIKVGDPLSHSTGDYYAETKIATEKMIEKSGVSYTIFRFTAIMGHPATDPLMFHMPLDTKLEIASTEDTAFALVKALSHIDELKSKTFNLSGGEKCRTTYREFIAHMFKIYGLNIRYLKDMAFAEKNFHCGYLKDSHILNDILCFQQDDLESYYNRVKTNTKGIIRFFSKIFSRPIVYFLMRKSPSFVENKND